MWRPVRHVTSAVGSRRRGACCPDQQARDLLPLSWAPPTRWQTVRREVGGRRRELRRGTQSFQEAQLSGVAGHRFGEERTGSKSPCASREMTVVVARSLKKEAFVAAQMVRPQDIT